MSEIVKKINQQVSVLNELLKEGSQQGIKFESEIKKSGRFQDDPNRYQLSLKSYQPLECPLRDNG